MSETYQTYSGSPPGYVAFPRIFNEEDEREDTHYTYPVQSQLGQNQRLHRALCKYLIFSGANLYLYTFLLIAYMLALWDLLECTK